MNDKNSDASSNEAPNENELSPAPTSLNSFKDGAQTSGASLREQRKEVNEVFESSEITESTKTPIGSNEPDPHGHNEAEDSDHVTLFEQNEDNWDDVVSSHTDFSEPTSEPVPEKKTIRRFSKLRRNPSSIVSSGKLAAAADFSILSKINNSPDLESLESPPEKGTPSVENEVQIEPVPPKPTSYVDDVDEFLREAYREADEVDKLLAEIDTVWPTQATPRKQVTSRPNRKPARLTTEDEMISPSVETLPSEPYEVKESQSEILSHALRELYLRHPKQSYATQQPDSLSQPQFVIEDDFIQNVAKDRDTGYVVTDASWEIYLLFFLAASIVLLAIGLWKRKVLKYVFHLKLGKSFDDGISLDYEKVLQEDRSPGSPRREVALVQSSFTPPPVSSTPRTRRNSGVSITREAMHALTMGRRSLTCASLPTSAASTPKSVRNPSRPKSSHRPTNVITDVLPASLNGNMNSLPPSWDDLSIGGAILKTAEDLSNSHRVENSGRRHNHKSSNSFDPSLMGFVASLSDKGPGSTPVLTDNDVYSVRSRGRTSDLVLLDARGNNLHMSNTELPPPGDAINSLPNHHRPLPFQLRAALGDLLPTVAASPLFPPEGEFGVGSLGLFEDKYNRNTATSLVHHTDNSLTGPNNPGNHIKTGTKLRRSNSVHSHLSSSLSSLQNEGFLSTPCNRSACLSVTSSPPVLQKRSRSYSRNPQMASSSPQLSNNGPHGRGLRKDVQGGWQDDGWGDW